MANPAQPRPPQEPAGIGVPATAALGVLGLLAAVAALQGRAMATFVLLVLAVTAGWLAWARTRRTIVRAGLLAVVAASALGIVSIQLSGTQADSRPSGAATESRDGSLEIVRTSVLDWSTVGTVHPLDPAEGDEHIDLPVNAIELLVRNTSTEVSVATEVSLEIASHASLDLCNESGPYEDVTAEYGVELPYPASPGDELHVPLSQSVPANDVDRFVLTVGIETDALVLSQLYELRVRLFHDGVDEPIDGGNVVVATPVAWPMYIDPMDPRVGECLIPNAEAIAELADADAALSPDFASLAQDARALLQQD